MSKLTDSQEESLKVLITVCEKFVDKNKLNFNELKVIALSLDNLKELSEKSKNIGGNQGSPKEEQSL